MTGTVIDLLKKYYDPLPGPGAESYEAALKVSEILAPFSKEPGIIACGYSSTYLYVGISPKLWDALGSSFSSNKQVVATLKTGIKGAIWTSSKVDESLLKTITFNKGCAEKRVLTAALEFSETVTEISVTEHPSGTDPGTLANHVALGSSSGGTFYAPCKSCIAFGKLIYKS